MKKEYFAPEFKKRLVLLDDVLGASQYPTNASEDPVPVIIATVPNEGPDF